LELIGHETKKEELKIFRKQKRKILYLRMKKGRCPGKKDETKIVGRMNEVRDERIQERRKCCYNEACRRMLSES
jgi:hypothetical protein